VNRLGSGGTGEIGLAGFERAESITPARSKSSDYFEQIPGAEHLAQRSASDEFWPSRGVDPHARAAGTAMRMSSRSHTRARDLALLDRHLQPRASIDRTSISARAWRE
jgi:hypothetical protein